MIFLNRWIFMIALFCCFHDWLLDGFSWFFLNDGFSSLVYLCRCSLLLLGGFGHASHPALIPAGAALSHLDPEVSTSETYSQVRDIPTYNLQICIKWNLRYGTASGNILRTIAPMLCLQFTSIVIYTSKIKRGSVFELGSPTHGLLIFKMDWTLDSQNNLGSGTTTRKKPHYFRLRSQGGGAEIANYSSGSPN